MSQNARMSMTPPTVTSDGKFLCEVDKKTFDSQEDYYKHCSEAHMESGASKNW